MDVNEAKGLGQIALPYVGWGTEFVDFDADGWLDLVVANGNTLEAEGPMPRKLKPQEPFLFWNQRGEFFHNLAPLCKPLAEPHNYRGLAVSDYDDDGAVDIAMIQLDEGVQLLHNDMQTGHWLKIRLRNRLKSGALLGFGDGSTVIAYVAGVPLRRTVSSTSYLSQSSRILHFGLGSAQQVDKLEVRWLGGHTNIYERLDGDTTWTISEGDPVPQRQRPRAVSVEPSANVRPPSAAGSQAQTNAQPAIEKAQLLKFWQTQRAAMAAMKIEKNIPKAVGLLRTALELNPSHEDSLYYLGNCLAMQGDWSGALGQLKALTQINPQSHRGHAQWGIIRALSANSDDELAAAQEALATAQQLNPEETGALLALSEVMLLRGQFEQADMQLANVCRTNPKAVGGFFLRGYLAWRNGQTAAAQELLQAARNARGKDWQPQGSTAEGDVLHRWHAEQTPLAQFWNEWDGATSDPAKAFAPLDKRLTGPIHR
jgi:hypothetical protein